MSLANTSYDVIGGFEVTQSTTTNANDTVTVASGVYRTRTLGITTYGNSAYTSVVGAAISGVIAYASTGYKRIDLVVVDTSTLATAPFKIITGTPVLAAATAVVPTIASSSQFPIATIAVSDSTVATISPRTDVRDTPDYLPVRAFNRSQNVRIGKQVVRSNSNVYVDLNDPVSAKELAYHSSIGAIYHTGALTSASGDLQVNTGLKAIAGTYSSSTLKISVGVGEIRNADNQTLYPIAVAADATSALAVAGTTNKLRNDLLYVDVSNPNSVTYGVLAGTAATATGTQAALAGVRFADLTKDQLALAVIVAPAAASAAGDFKIIDVRPVR
jgi:hypothetical protein